MEAAPRFCPDWPPRRLKTVESPWLAALGLFPDPGESDPSLSNTEDFLELPADRSNSKWSYCRVAKKQTKNTQTRASTKHIWSVLISLMCKR